MVTARITGRKVAVVGVGGTGSWVLDLLARCPLEEIHLFDDDRYLQHNAFRSPGPTPEAELAGGASKVDVYAQRWASMRTGVIAHPVRLGEQHAELLSQMDIVFVCVDTGDSRRQVAEVLERAGCDFIDVGMGLLLDEERSQVFGQLRTTLSTPDTREQGRQHMPLSGGGGDAVYARNIQTRRAQRAQRGPGRHPLEARPRFLHRLRARGQLHLRHRRQHHHQHTPGG